MVSRMERYVDPRHQPRINACPADNKFVRGFALQCDLPSFPRWPSSSTSVIDGSARRERSRRGYERLGPLISTLAEEREGRMLNRNRFFPFSYLRNWWVESIFFENCVFLSSFLLLFFFFKEILCFSSFCRNQRIKPCSPCKRENKIKS